MISFSKRANLFDGVCLFCIFVTNEIYVTSTNWLRVVVVARYQGFDKSDFYKVVPINQNIRGRKADRKIHGLQRKSKC